MSAATGNGETDWLTALGAGDDRAVGELRRLVRERLGRVLGPRRDVADADLDDFTQDACLRILASLATFRGDARFTTWAMTIAVRVAMTALRRRRWSGDEVASRLEQCAGPVATCNPGGAVVETTELFQRLRAAIDERLTARQRQVVLAELSGIPQVLIAEHLGSAPNAIYKVSHDARKKLRSALEESGFDAESVRQIIGTAAMEAT